MKSWSGKVHGVFPAAIPVPIVECLFPVPEASSVASVSLAEYIYWLDTGLAFDEEKYLCSMTNKIARGVFCRPDDLQEMEMDAHKTRREL